MPNRDKTAASQSCRVTMLGFVVSTIDAWIWRGNQRVLKKESISSLFWA